MIAPMRILLVTYNFPPGGGGAGVVYYQLCKHLNEELIPLVPTDSVGCADRFDALQSFRVFRVPYLRPRPTQSKPSAVQKCANIASRLMSRVPVAYSLVRYIRQLKPEIVCIGNLTSLYWLAPLSRVMGGAVVFYIHGEEISDSRSRGAVSRWFFNRSVSQLKKADRVIAVSCFTYDLIMALGVSPDKVALIYNGVEHERFFPGPADQALLARHDLQGKRVILTVARLDARKGHDTVLRALPGVLRVIPTAVYLVVGDGAERRRLEALADSLGLGASVVFVGQACDAELGDYYRLCEVFVQPNRRMPDGDDEGFGLVFLEAGACCLPVIGGRSGGVPEAVIDGETGLLVDGNSSKETEDAIIRVLTDRQLASELARKGFSRAQQFDWRRTSKEFLELCKQAIEGAVGLSRPSALPRVR